MKGQMDMLREMVNGKLDGIGHDVREAARAGLAAERVAKGKNREVVYYADLVDAFREWEKVRGDGTGRTVQEVLDNARASGALLGNMSAKTFEKKLFPQWVAWGRPDAARFEKKWKQKKRKEKQ